MRVYEQRPPDVKRPAKMNRSSTMPIDFAVIKTSKNIFGGNEVGGRIQRIMVIFPNIVIERQSIVDNRHKSKLFLS